MCGIGGSLAMDATEPRRPWPASGTGGSVGKRPRILTLIDHYPPAYKAGGPVRSVSNLVERLGDDLEFWVVTRDRDLGEAAPLPGVRAGVWTRVGLAMVYYAAPWGLSPAALHRLAREVMPDVVYLNSFFSTLSITYLALRRLGLAPAVPVILAPRGELSPGALALKRTKKQIFVVAARAVKLHEGIIYQASAELEKKEISTSMFGNTSVRVAPNPSQPVKLAGDANIRVAPDLPRLEAGQMVRYCSKRPGAARFIFLSRISPKKNLRFALDLLRYATGDVVLDVFGPLESHAYWEGCQGIIQSLPPSVRVSYKGAVEYSHVAETLAGYHFLLFPTLSENFGHVIFEALGTGCPLVISDRTPWRGLVEKGLGWDIPLEEPTAWRQALAECVAMDGAQHEQLAARCVSFARLALNVGRYPKESGFVPRGRQWRECAGLMSTKASITREVSCSQAKNF